MWTEKVRYLLGVKRSIFSLQQQRVRAEINVLLPRDQTFDNLVDLGMHQRLAAGNGNHRRAAFVHRLEALFRREIHLQNVRRILNFSAARARQIAAEQRFQHQHQRIAAAPASFCLST